MDQSELDNDMDDLNSFYEGIFSAGDLEDADEKIRTEEPDLSIDNELVEILEQRKKHKDKLLSYLMWLTSIIFGTFVLFLICKIVCKIILGLDIISDRLLEIFVVSMFVEVITVIRGITKALWDEKGILSSPLIDKLIKK